MKKYYEMREIINRAKMKPCVDCGIQYSSWIMEFDHRDPSEKKFGIGTRGTVFGRAKIIAEIGKCDVVCANCHAERTHRNKDKILKRRKVEV